MASKRDAKPFEIGETVVRRYDQRQLTVLWVSKGASDRADQLIATEENDYCNPYSSASTFTRATA